MATILQVLNRVKSVKLNEEIPKIIQASAYDITALVSQQMYSGRRSDGQKITPKYKGTSYARKKFNLNGGAGYGTPDLFLTGNMYKGLNVSVKSRTFEITSSVSYYPKLVKSYGDKPFGMSDKSKSEYAQGIVRKKLAEHLSRTTRLL